MNLGWTTRAQPKIYVSPFQGSKYMPSHPGLRRAWASMCRPPGFCRFAAVVDWVDWVDVVDGG
jgi:hypothetical protein